MIRNESTSRLIASKNGDRDELLKLASSLIDRFLLDIIPNIAGAVENSILPVGVIELAITTELTQRTTRKYSKIRQYDKFVRNIWDGDGKEENQEELLKIIVKLESLR